MLLNELYDESVAPKSLDEIDLSNVGRKVGRALGGVGRTVGAVAGVPQGLGRAMKRGYQTSVRNIGGDDDAPATDSGTKSIRTQSGAMNPATGKAWTPDELRTWAMARKDSSTSLPTAQATTPATQTTQATTPATQTTTAALPKVTDKTQTAYSLPAAGYKQATYNVPTGSGVKLPEPTKTSTDAGQQSKLIVPADGYRSRTAAQQTSMRDLSKPQTTAKVTPTTAPTTPTGDQEPIYIGGQKITPKDPRYASIVKNLPPGFLQKSTAPVSEMVLHARKMLKEAKTTSDVKTIKEFIERSLARRGVLDDQTFDLRDGLMRTIDRYFAANQQHTTSP